ASQRRGNLELAAPREHLRTRCTPEDLGVNVVRPCCFLALARQLIRLVVAILRVQRSGEQGGDGREVALLAKLAQHVVTGTKLPFRCDWIVGKRDEAKVDAEQPCCLADLVHNLSEPAKRPLPLINPPQHPP